MSKEFITDKCKMCGPGHTTFDCPKLGGFKMKIDNDELKNTTDEDIEDWKNEVLKYYSELDIYKEKLVDLKRLGGQQFLADSLDVLNKIINQCKKILDLTYNFLAQNPSVPLGARQLAEALFLEVEDLLSASKAAKLNFKKPTV